MQQTLRADSDQKCPYEDMSDDLVIEYNILKFNPRPPLFPNQLVFIAFFENIFDL